MQRPGELDQYKKLYLRWARCRLGGRAGSVGERSNFKKKILRTRKIMVMHNNERGECYPRTLVDRKRKRYDNVVDVVVHLHDPTDPSTERTAPPSSAHVQLNDVPRTPIQ